MVSAFPPKSRHRFFSWTDGGRKSLRSLISKGFEDVVWLEERQLSLTHAQGDVFPGRLKKSWHCPSLQITPKIMSLCSVFPQLPEHLKVWRRSGSGSCEVVASPNRYVPHLG